MNASSPAPGNYRWRGGMGSRGHTGQQDNQSEVVVPSEMERLQNGTQLMGTSRKCSCTRHYRGLLSETPRSQETHLVGRIFLPPFPTHHHAETSQFWRGGLDVRGHHSPTPITPITPITPAIPDSPWYIPPHKQPNLCQLLETRP